MRVRLVASFVVVLAIVLIAQNAPLIDYLRGVEEDRQRTGLERDAFVIAGRSEELLEEGLAAENSTLQTLVDEYRSTEGHRVVIVDRIGSVAVISDETAAAGADYSTRPEIGRALTGQIASGRRASETLGLELVYVAVPVFSGDDIVGAVRLTSPSGEIDDLVSRRIRGIVAVVLIALALGVVVALVLAQEISRPLRSLKRSTDQLASGDLTTRAEADTGPSEVRELATAFNRMSARLQSLVEAQRSFASDASHQLRTPLTALRLQIEQARHIAETDPSRSRVELERATSEIDRLQHLVDGLLVLARLENSTALREAIDARTVIEDRIGVWQPLVEEREGTISLVAVEGPARVDLMPGTLEQILDNLIANSLDAGDEPPDILVDLRHDLTSNRIRFAVMDRGRGMSDAEIGRAFDRFWRSSRNVSTGSGVGLSIVRRLVEVNDGSIALLPRPGGGLVVEVEFPTTTVTSVLRQ
jgi:signal transduction histidine kinase